MYSGKINLLEKKELCVRDFSYIQVFPLYFTQVFHLHLIFMVTNYFGVA